MPVAIASPSPRSVASLRVDTAHEEGTVAQDWRLARVIGVGGMGIVYSGVQLSTGREVAVKLLRREHASNVDAKRRFLAEARLLGQLRGTHLPRVLDAGQADDGTLYMVLELIQGPNLRWVLNESRLQPAQAVALLLQVCEAAGEAHDLGIVHRDIKPENVVVAGSDTDTVDGTVVKLVDFGIAKHAESCSSHRCSHYTLGSPEYMAPEQYAMPDAVDARADVWSLGLLLFELICGELPQGDEQFSAGGSRLGSVVTMPPNVPEGLQAVIVKCLEPRPQDRFSNARELGQALLPFRTGTNDGQRDPAISRDRCDGRPRRIPQFSGVFRVPSDGDCETLAESGSVEPALELGNPDAFRLCVP
jgi:serine/threonine-protein kinase